MQADGSDRVGGPPQRRRPVVFAAIALCVIAALGWAVRSLMVSTDTRLPPVAVQSPGSKAPPPVVNTTTAATPSDLPPPVHAAPAPATATPDGPPLPALEASDDEVRSTLTDVLPAAAVTALAPAELIRRIAVMAESFGRGKVLRDRLPLPAPTGKMAVIEREDRIFLAPENFTRYDTLTDMVAAVDVDATVRWITRYEPLLQQAWGELGTDGGSVRGAMIAGLDLLLATPDLEGEIELVQPAVFYRYADPSVESLADVQKLLIRAGPGNRGVIKARARSLRDALANAP